MPDHPAMPENKTESQIAPTRITLIHRYFWPDTSPYGILLRKIAEHLASEGNQVSVFTGQPTYSKESDASQSVQLSQDLGEHLTVKRVKLLSQRRFRPIFRAINDLIFCIGIIWFVLRKKPQVVMCSTQPPVIGAAAAGWAARRVGAKFIYHLQDIHPEVVCETGHVRHSFLMKLLQKIDVRTVQRADRIVLLSEDMRDSMMDRVAGIKDKIEVIPNFNLPRFDDLKSPPEEWMKTPGVFRMMFAGNIGRFQNLDSIVDACLQVPDKTPFEFVLMGDGKAKEELREKAIAANDDRIKFIDRQPLSMAEPLMADADLCVVSLEPKVYRYAFPSKLASYLSLGTAVLVVCESDSELSRLPIEFGFGLSCNQSPVADILEQIQYAIGHPDEVAGMRVSAGEFFSSHFSRDQVMPQWTQLLQRVLG
ncbi:glycosyltransferase family 4 protein [Planctomycetes bacterium K23_9]|uniref:Putative glycosyl transferase n=1 Tax=Stieleria marina TaxID=1930275 RepID=A0A517NSJ8_9BACT|nr:putative glycosyl transferase [Planctomycetes bacterium K23_9]